MRSLLVVCSVLVAFATPARANPDGITPSLTAPVDLDGKPGAQINAVATIEYGYEIDRAAIMRERAGDPSAVAGGALPVQKDLLFHQYKHTLTPKLEVGFARDAWVYAALPIVITQSRELKLDGIDRTASSTVADGILPMSGYDAQAPMTPPAGDTMFRGVDRHGLDQIYLGIGVAPMNQRRDATKPTWKLGAEIRIPVGKVARFDPTAPSDNTAVGTGAYELKLWTSFDRRIGWVEPWIEVFWQVPVGYNNASLFDNPGYGASNTDMQQQGGVQFGFEAFAVDDAEHNKISLDLGASAVAHFEGRAYSEMWEVFAAAGHGATDPLVLDADPTTMGLQPLAHPGITNVENYLETAARIALRAELGPHVRFAVLGDLIWKTDHAISFADAGIDRNNNLLVDPGTGEINPLHVDKIDLVGHRYLSTNNFGVVIGVHGTVLF